MELVVDLLTILDSGSNCCGIGDTSRSAEIINHIKSVDTMNQKDLEHKLKLLDDKIFNIEWNMLECQKRDDWFGVRQCSDLLDKRGAERAEILAQLGGPSVPILKDIDGMQISDDE